METKFTGLMSDNGYDYPTVEEMRNIFAASCVEALASELHLSAADTYRRMKHVDLFRDLIFPCYDTLHTQSRAIVTEDVMEALRVREERQKREAA